MSGRQPTVARPSGTTLDPPEGIVSLVFRCRPGEAREVRWMTRAEITDAMAPAFAIRALNAFEPQPRSRTHDGVHLLDADLAGG